MIASSTTNFNPAVIVTKKCSSCGGEWDLEACYRKNPERRWQVHLPEHQYRPVCVMCELTERNDPTPEERARRKAHNSIVQHAEKFGMKPIEFAKRYDWDIGRMIYDILHGYANTCTYCYERYEVMGHGLSDITLDVVDPKLEPYYRTNVRWCCQTCNREKAAMSPELWARRCAAWPKYMQWRDLIRRDQTHGLPLFQDPSLL